MKQSKKIQVLTMLCVLMAVLLTACGQKTATDKETFASVLDSHDFEVVDQSSMIAEGSDFSVVYLAQPNSDETDTESEDTEISEDSETGLFSGQYQIEFYKFNDADSCESTYDTLDDELVSSYKSASGYATTEKSSGSYERRNVTTDSRYYVITRIEDTLIVAISPVSEKDTLNSILKELGY